MQPPVKDPIAALAEDYLERLVRLPSARGDARGAWPEQAVAEAIEAIASEEGLALSRDELGDGRRNLLIDLPANTPEAPTILIAGHMDTVPAGGMPNPFVPRRSGGRLYARGACDTKGPLAMALAVVVAIARSGRAPALQVRLAATVDEETAMDGARHLAGTIAPVDLVLALEPTELRLVDAHMGVFRCWIETAGEACHSSRPERGRNAIDLALAVIADLRQLETVLAEPHLRLGAGSFCLTRIDGGSGPNVVPDRCRFALDLRLPPARSSASIRQLVEAAIAGRASLEPIVSGDGIQPTGERRVAEHLAAVLGRHGLDPTPDAVRYATDCAQLHRLGPCVVWGPGSIAQAHAVDEHLALDQLALGCAVLHETLTTDGSWRTQP